MASRTRKSWAEKLASDKGLPRVIRLTGEARQRWGATMVVPAPAEVDALMRQVPRGRLVTIHELRRALARQHKTEVACPLTTGIFSWIAAHAAAEAGGGRGTTAYWRTLKAGGEVNAKYPGGALAVCRRLRAEGHKVVKHGVRYFVAEWEKKLASGF